jgi:diaminohydroxyphosphoribosylaminopyrimidine deaminase/5-amino-6-(5-phosphoribosylamino)uracil reductase
MSRQETKKYLDLAARSAMRGFGHVEPNPMVGAVLVRDGVVIGIGHHTRFGSLHAEREALANCRAQGNDPAGATLYCTLEPCCHHGKQPPCTQAVIDAGIKRVVIARLDPADVSSGGVQILTSAGIEVELSDESVLATRLSDPFINRVRTGRPWVIAKWAQTLDGRIATSTGESQWITGPLCRRRVHRLRSRVDAVMIGIGTVIADDPMLTARDTRSVRRVAQRVVLDSSSSLSSCTKLAQTAHDYPTVLCTTEGCSCEHADIEHIAAGTDRVDIALALAELSSRGVGTILVEAGPRVLGSLLEEDLIDEIYVHLAPGVIGDEQALPVATGRTAPSLSDMRRFKLFRTKSIGDDVELHYRRRV